MLYFGFTKSQKKNETTVKNNKKGKAKLNKEINHHREGLR